MTYLVKKNTSPEKCRKTSPAFLPRLYWRIAAARRFRGQGASPECVALWEGVTMPRLLFCFTVKNRRSEGLSRWGMLLLRRNKKSRWAALVFLCQSALNLPFQLLHAFQIIRAVYVECDRANRAVSIFKGKCSLCVYCIRAIAADCASFPVG